MKFQSTRDANKIKYPSAQVIKQGLADDGGLFVPEAIPHVTHEDILSFCKLPYHVLAAKILTMYLTDYCYDELLSDCKMAYSEASFPGGACQTVKVNDNTYSLELWHGPTCAFKDMALQIMPRLLSRALTMTGEDRTALILVATSGDTGKAALEGYKDIDRVKISVFYPESGVSTIQKLQMVTQTGSNVNVCGVNGNFDDIQSAVKRIFSDTDFAKELSSKGYLLSSANSINFGRLAPQIVYYFKSYCDLINEGKIVVGDKINVCVPTGNFGNILAAYIAKLMGLPIGKLICASNSNNVLTEFLRTGTYNKNREFKVTSSPSMDILISSNLERLLYFVCGENNTAEYMKSLNDTGRYILDIDTLSAINNDFIGYFTDEYTTMRTVQDIHDNYGYLIDTHTGVAFSALDQYREETGDQTIAIVASTANPYKFAKDVHDAIYDDVYLTDLQAFHRREKLSGDPIPAPLKDIEKREVKFDRVISPDEMYEEIKRFINK